jgi:transcriptional regulator with XRE-family HTH domain
VARTLREWRKSTGFTMEEVAQKLRWSQPKLSRFERAEVNAGPAEIIALATILGVDDDERDAVVALAMSSTANSGWWSSYGPETVEGDLADYIETEADAELVRSIEIMVIPGLLQTRDYSEALIRSWNQEPNEIVTLKRRKLRQQRQDRLYEEVPLKLHAIIHEGALRQEVGGSEIMRAQLLHLVQAAAYSNIHMQLLPISIGAYPGFGISYTLIDFNGGDTKAVYLDTLSNGVFIEDIAKVNTYISNFEYLAKVALDKEQSSDLIAHILSTWT